MKMQRQTQRLLKKVNQIPRHQRREHKKKRKKKMEKIKSYTKLGKKIALWSLSCI